MTIKNKVITTPCDDRVRMESRDIFSAWPILFNGKRDPGGLSFDRSSQLQPPFDEQMIIFRFYVANDDRPDAPYQVTDMRIASVLSWKLTAAGLWIRGGFVEPPVHSGPVIDIITKLKQEIKAGHIGLTYSAYKDPKFMDISETGHVRKLPIVAFSLYERPQDAEEIPAGSAETAQ